MVFISKETSKEDKVRKYYDSPEVGEYVMATIVELNPSSAIAVLDEYDNKKAMIHISEVSSRWVKDIRKFLRLNQKVVAQVINLDRRGFIELSIKRVKPTIAREKVKEFRNEKKAHNFLKLIGEQLGYSLDEMYEKAGFPLQKEYGLMYAGFEVAAEEGVEPLLKIGIPKDIAEKIVAFAYEYIKPKELVIKGDITLKVYESNGIDIIKEALSFDDPKIIIKYIASPIYRLELIGEDYKEMERKLKGVIEEIENRLKSYDAEFGFARIKE